MKKIKNLKENIKNYSLLFINYIGKYIYLINIYNKKYFYYIWLFLNLVLYLISDKSFIEIVLILIIGYIFWDFHLKKEIINKKENLVNIIRFSLSLIFMNLYFLFFFEELNLTFLVEILKLMLLKILS